MGALTDQAALAAALADTPSEQEARDAIARLDDADLHQIDQAILAALDRSWKPAGLITTGLVLAAPDAHEDLPELVYALRIHALAASSRIETRGDPRVLRTFEIRLPTARDDD
ncbi:hypothetical protein [Luteimonas deserti]|uniref:Uncharacterized protein n=1 Tax=Luteimonas deserti TaxID=2752306 RepID=A0A7Z0QN00_9GAMM|nr:hypothetical protein [Luteimonas deserti]NYZ61528.1 hypothetical protein [Luteimonas deserti]